MSTSTITHNDSALIPPDNDLALVQNAKEGSLTAFGELVKPHERQMFRIAHNLLHNREDAEDAVQVALLKAFQKLLQFQAKAKFSTWLGRITFNEALTKLRRDPVRRNSIGHNCPDEAGPLSQEIADWAPNPEMLYTVKELRNILESNLCRLNPNLRTVFLLHDVEGFSMEDTAETLGLTVAAVKARSWRARLQLREWLQRYFRNEKHLAVARACFDLLAWPKRAWAFAISTSRD
ncbi:MAG TPA: sigma-70 family RNA polymerase sigma factor [Pyrinomonadaceae bacterium]|nr:sigma-70 family RNA polymerase sigma factor [Pyrinomonadaceae bacterium]